MTGKQTVAEVWPELRLVIHGGTKFDPYRDLFRREIGSDAREVLRGLPVLGRVHRHRGPAVRPAPDRARPRHLLRVRAGGGAGAGTGPTRHTLADVEVGVQYAVVLTSCAGRVGVPASATRSRSSGRDPPLIRFTGRTKYFLSAFGEHLISEEVEKAVAHAGRGCAGWTRSTSTSARCSRPTRRSRGTTCTWSSSPARRPRTVDRFAAELDAELCRLNEDYAAHRVGDLSDAACREVRAVQHGGFAEWMKARGQVRRPEQGAAHGQRAAT